MSPASLADLRIGVSLPVRELQDDLAGIRDFARTAEELASLTCACRTWWCGPAPGTCTSR